MKKSLTLILSVLMLVCSHQMLTAQCTSIADGAGPYTDFQFPPCDTDCGTAVAPAFQVWGNEGYIVNVTAGSEYVFEFCTGYNAGLWPATITVAEWDGTMAGTVIGFVDGCTYTFTTPNDGQVMIYVSVTTDCGGAYLQGDANNNGSPTLDCGPNGATCAPAGPCEAGTYTGPDPMNVCDGFPVPLTLDGAIAADGEFGINFSNATTNGTGGTGNPVTLTGVGAADFPYDVDAGLQGVIAANMLTNFDGEWVAKVYAFDIQGEPCDSTAEFTINFINDATDPICQALDIDDLVEVTDWNISPNPSNGPVVISLNLDASYDVSVQIFDVTGKLIGSKFSDDVKSVNYEFDLSDQANGVYLAKIGVDGNFSTEKIMINK